ncbi:helix-turn-helix transcriptional regulator [Psychromonas aquatilis]|uniref:Helix-turn-helix transcriptional regulator n=1 Tax=Psychromonas aquatilis TaxID=2005072 RepID=A0ABU9GMA2_9GAMM
MLKCHLSKIMGEKRLKMSDVSRDTGINPGTIRRMFNETATRVELNVVETLCKYLEVEVGELYELPEKGLENEAEEKI